MGDKRNRKGIGLKRRFNLPGGIHSKKTKYAQAQKYKKGEYLDKVKLKHFKGPSYQIKCLKTCVSGKPRIKFIARRIPLNKRKGFRFIKDARKDTTGTFVERQETLDGSRIMNLEMLQSYVSQATTHSALCESARKYAMKGESPMTLIGEKKHGFASILSLKCNGCGKTYQIQTSKTCKTPSGDYFEINVRAVWGSMVTGGGCSSTNESLGTMGIPGISERNYSKLEEEIGDWWLKILEEDMKKAGEEERKIAIENGDHFQGVPAITVVCDGGWSKRSHKHTYNAMGGVAVIFGHRTKKLLHIGVRNRLCYICSQAQTKNLDPRPHRCFKNWNDSAQAMESDIILEGFLSAEQKYGLRFMNIISDGDSSTFSEIQNKVPVWGKFVKKLECANHACKCLRSHLEQLVSEKPQHKGKGKLTKLARVKIVTAVRCAIKMRSVEKDKKKAVTKLKTDIKNAGRHVLGLHDLCKTDFCKHQQEKKDNNVIDDKSDEQEQNETDSDIVYDQEIYWQDSLKTISTSEENNLRKGGNSVSNVDEELLKDIFFYLNRMADKSERLIGNFTSNLAESWMHIRCKFDGGKMVNKCFKSSFYGRCYGGALRSLKGPGWSPMVYQEITGEKPDSPYIDTYRRRARKHVNSIRSQNNPVNKNRKRKRKLGTEKQCSSKKAKMHYGENVLDDSEDVPTSVLQRKMKDYYEANVCKNEDDIKKIEHDTRQQSLSKKWKDERKKRLTSSIFGEVVSRSVNNNNPALVNRLLYTDFKGNKFTRKGLQQESVTIQEYTNKMKAEGQECNVENSGLVICSSHPCLAASTDGIVNLSDGTKGLIEVKNLLQNNQLLIKEAVSKQSNFCLCKTSDGSIQLKRKHKYFFQVQGQLNVFNLEWCDFVVRRTDPYDIFIERIKRDIKLWVEIMRPKLITFYFNHMLPELASPRLGTVSGIRKASVPWVSIRNLNMENDI